MKSSDRVVIPFPAANAANISRIIIPVGRLIKLVCRGNIQSVMRIIIVPVREKKMTTVLERAGRSVCVCVSCLFMFRIHFHAKNNQVSRLRFICVRQNKRIYQLNSSELSEVQFSQRSPENTDTHTLKACFYLEENRRREILCFNFITASCLIIFSLKCHQSKKENQTEHCPSWKWGVWLCNHAVACVRPPPPQATEGKTKHIGLERGQVQQVVQGPKEKVSSFLYIFSDGSAVDNINLLLAHRCTFRASDTQTHAGNSNSRCRTVAGCRVSSS